MGLVEAEVALVCVAALVELDGVPIGPMHCADDDEDDVLMLSECRLLLLDDVCVDISIYVCVCVC